MSGALDPVAKILAGVVGGSAAGPAGRAVGGDGRQSEARSVATWGVVASVSPLRVTLPTAGGPAEMTPVTLVNPADLAPGVKVRLEYVGRVLTITGRQWGGARDQAAAKAAADAAALEAWRPLVLASDWAQYGTASSWGAPEYRVVRGRVEFSGMVTGTMGKDTPIATVPPDAVPRRNRIFSGIENYTPVSVQCTAGGLLYANPVRSTPWLSLSSLSYPL